MAHDKHVRAYEVLLTERSRIIERNYRRLPDLKEARPEKDALCLRCHSMDADAVLHGQRLAFADGIGCERCHGPAEKWLTTHYLLDWKQKSAADKERLGFHELKDLTRRAQLCIECHVGTPQTQVDHDLYGAGHPRVYFEYSSFLAVMPPHWSLREERARYPDVQARSWAIGQVTCAAASLDLLAFRADPKSERPWPEFAEYDCYACHHQLRADSGPVKRGYGGRVPGTLPFNDWNYALLGAVELDGQPLGGADWKSAYGELRKAMSQPLPDQETAAKAARAAAQALRPQLQRIEQTKRLDARQLRGWFDTLDREKQSLGGNWDSAAQCYLALAAIHNGLTDLDPKEKSAALRERLRKMAAELRFPKKIDSPGIAPPYFGEPHKSP
jgi:Cytochrome c554 and c-prime